MKTSICGFLTSLAVLAFLVLPSTAQTAGGGTEGRGQPCQCESGGVECLFGSAAQCQIRCEFGQLCDCKGARCTLGFPIGARCRCKNR